VLSCIHLWIRSNVTSCNSQFVNNIFLYLLRSIRDVTFTYYLLSTMFFLSTTTFFKFFILSTIHPLPEKPLNNTSGSLYDDGIPSGFPGLLNSERRARFQRVEKVSLLRQALKTPVNIIGLVAWTTRIGIPSGPGVLFRDLKWFTTTVTSAREKSGTTTASSWNSWTGVLLHSFTLTVQLETKMETMPQTVLGSITFIAKLPEDDLVRLALRVIVHASDQLRPALRFRISNSVLQLFTSRTEFNFGHGRGDSVTVTV